MFGTSEASYSVYQMEAGDLSEKEFSFSIDCLRPFFIMPWYSFHDEDAHTKLLAHLMSVLRQNGSFIRAYDTILDKLLREKDILGRGEDGCLHELSEFVEWPKYAASIPEDLDKKGFVEAAVEILKKAGIASWRNCCGHVSVDPGSARNEVRRRGSNRM